MILLLVSACAAQPPDRSPLPDLAGVLPEPLGCQLGVGDTLGVSVTNVIADTPAVGVFEENDLIVEVDGQALSDVTQLFDVMASYNPGDTIEVTYVREIGQQTSSVTLAANPTDETRPLIGINVETAIERIPLDDAGDVVTPSPTSRAMEIAGRLFVIDPLAHTWQPLGVTTPDNPRWFATSNGIYTMTDETPPQVEDVLANRAIDDDGYRGWAPRQIVGVVGDTLVILVTTDVVDQPDLINVAVAGFDPLTGTTLWVTPSVSGFGVPLAAIGSLDGSAFLLVGTDGEAKTTGMALFTSAGVPLDGEVSLALGDPIGWFGPQSQAFLTSREEVTVANVIQGTSIVYPLPQELVGAALTTVGDGQHILAISGRDLVVYDLASDGDRLHLATNCSVGRSGEPGWGL